MTMEVRPWVRMMKVVLVDYDMFEELGSPMQVVETVAVNPHMQCQVRHHGQLRRKDFFF
jgi:hypothetical protein